VPQATDIYKRLLIENRDDLALNVYVAMCYYKLDYYDVSLEILQVYLQVCTVHTDLQGIHTRLAEPRKRGSCKPEGLQPFPTVQWEGR
jgi:hypothetical protein